MSATSTTSAPHSPDDVTALALLQRWDDQQAAYISRREERFEVLLDVVATTAPADGLVLDLACGPGSISARVAARFPTMRCVGVDLDPALLHLGRDAAAERGDGDRVELLDADLHDPRWTEVLSGARPDVVLSSTALHWLPAPTLVRVYADLGRLLAPGATFLNADHLRAATGRTTFEDLARRDDEATQARAHAAGVEDWDTWFSALSAVPRYADDLRERSARFADRPPSPDLSPAFHVEALRVAGFAEAGVVWQHWDDYVVHGRR